MMADCQTMQLSCRLCGEPALTATSSAAQLKDEIGTDADLSELFDFIAPVVCDYHFQVIHRVRYLDTPTIESVTDGLAQLLRRLAAKQRKGIAIRRCEAVADDAGRCKQYSHYLVNGKYLCACHKRLLPLHPERYSFDDSRGIDGRLEAAMAILLGAPT